MPGVVRLEIKASGLRMLVGIAGMLAIATVLILYLRSNISWQDKDYYLDARSEVSESVARNYLNAPTYCEGFLFQWGTGNPDEVRALAEPMNRHRISVFAPKQTWSLHGDWPLQSVQVLEKEGTTPVRWLDGLREDMMCVWHSPLPLNLCLHSPNSVIWKLELPDDLKDAEFVTRCSLGQIPNAPRSAVKDGVTLCILIVRDDGSLASRILIPAKRWGQWTNIQLPLSEFKGKRIQIVLTSEGGQYAGDDLALFQEPHVNVTLDETLPQKHAATKLDSPRPSNTDLSPAFPQSTNEDFRLAPFDSSNWKVATLASEDKCTSLAGKNTEFTYLPEVELPINNVSHLAIQVQAIGKFVPRLVRARLEREQPGDIFIDIPLLGDDGIHNYSYDLRLLELDPADKIKRVHLVVPGLPDKPVKLMAVSLIRKNQVAVDARLREIHRVTERKYAQR